MKQIVGALFFAALMMATPVTLRWAQAHGFLPMSSEEVSDRIVGVLVGLMLAWLANLGPKSLTPLAETNCEPSRAQRMGRFSASSFVLAGLGFAAIWLFAPIEHAEILSMAVVGGAIVVTLLRCFAFKSAA